ncbi:hypothetical protein [Singulisphaera sp. PoT]|uniref:hypothetical protein n=1 Tax=Singulisphaera sp. PoT TaxID=3411797 RepID=UPI003BF50988
MRPAPPALDDFETDANKDGVPDGWYNARDAIISPTGGKVGPHCIKFETHKPGRPSRLSRAFGIDGRKHEAVVVGAWIRQVQIENGERLGEEPGLILDFLGDGLRALRRGMLGPWSKSVGPRWTYVSKRIPVPPGTRDVIMSMGLLGATGVLEIDGITFDLVPVGGKETTNLVNNGGFELGDPSPTFWIVENDAHRVFPGVNSNSALELSKSSTRVLTGLAIPIEPFGSLEVTMSVKAQGLRGSGGALASMFFLDADGEMVSGGGRSAQVFRWSGSFDWQAERATVSVPGQAVRAVLQLEKHDGNGTVRVDNVAVSASPNRSAGSWIPYHVAEDTTGWQPVTPSAKIAADSALDASFLLDAPAGKHGFVTVKGGRLTFSKGGRARFFGVSLLPPAAFQDSGRADQLVDRLARSGINLVRLCDLDTPIGPDRSLFDDSRDDTKAFDPIALERLDHLIAALKSRGIYVALELQSARRFRAEDEVSSLGALPPGGGGAVEFDPTIKKLAKESAQALLAHVNPETGLALKDDPALAFVTLGGELSLFDQSEAVGTLPLDYQDRLRLMASQESMTNGRRYWQSLGASHWRGLADTLRKDKLRVPIAGVSHWRRDAEFSAQQSGEGLDFVDDRLYWNPPLWSDPNKRSILWSSDGGLVAGAKRKRRAEKPYVVGQWCNQTLGAWALPYEAGDLILSTSIASAEDWDGLVRRGIFVYPRLWGNDATGTGGEEDIFAIPEVVNGIPQVFALWPHAASIMLRPAKPTAVEALAASRPDPKRRTNVSGWDSSQGRLTVNTPFTQGIAGWVAGYSANFDRLSVSAETPFAVVLASSANATPLASTKRILVTAIGRVQPTGFRWVDEWKRDVADPGIPPLLQEPIEAKVLWRVKGNVKAYALDNDGVRGKPVPLAQNAEGVELPIGKNDSTIHFELVVE